jgi:hypothetical protein
MCDLGGTCNICDRDVVSVEIFDDGVELSVRTSNWVACGHAGTEPTGYGGENAKVGLNLCWNSRRLGRLALVTVAWGCVFGVWNRDVDVNRGWCRTIDPSLDGGSAFGWGKGVSDGLESPAFVEELLRTENGVVVVEGIEEIDL